MDSGQDAFNHELMIATSTELKVLYLPVPVLNYLPVLLCIAINMLSQNYQKNYTDTKLALNGESQKANEQTPV